MASEVLQKLDLSQRTLGQNLLAEDIGNLLDRNAFLGLGIRGRTMMTEKSARVRRVHQSIAERKLTRQYHKRLDQAPW
jgi:hypothetical protein